MVTNSIGFVLRSLLLCSVFSGKVLALELPHTAHPHLEISDNLSIDQVMQAALERAPQQSMGAALRTHADDQQRAGNSLIANAPRLNMSYWDDSSNDDTGLREMEAGIEFDLWRWGQRSNARDLAGDLREGAESWETWLQLQVAGKVRASLHQLALSDTRTHYARQAVKEAESLLSASQKLLNTGAISRNALLQSEALVLEAQQHLLNEQAEQVDAERAYAVLTGLPLRPAAFAESAPLRAVITPNHPQLRYLEARRQQQASTLARERYQAGDNTTVSIGMRRERGSAMEPDIESLGIAISIPFGGSSHRRASAAAEAVALTEAEIQLQTAQRQLSMQLHEVRHQLDVIDDSIAYAERSRALLQERWRMTQKAFELGESDIQPTILALRAYHDSQLQLELLQLRKQFLISSLNQTVGELP